MKLTKPKLNIITSMPSNVEMNWAYLTALEAHNSHVRHVVRKFRSATITAWQQCCCCLFPVVIAMVSSHNFQPLWSSRRPWRSSTDVVAATALKSQTISHHEPLW